MKKVFFILLPLVLIVLIVNFQNNKPLSQKVDAQTADTDWPQLQHDSAKSGFQPNITIKTNTHSSTGYGNPVWTWSTTEPITGQVIVMGSTVAIAARNGKVFAINESNGTQKWVRDLSSLILGTVAMTNNKVIVATYEGKLYGLNITDGTIAWSYTGATAGYQTSPTVANGMIYIGSEDGKMHAVNADTGTALWTFQVGGTTDATSLQTPIISEATVSNGKVYFGAENMQVYALNQTNGTVLWKRALKGQSFHNSWVVASSQNGGTLLVRTQMNYAFHDELNDDETFLVNASGLSESTILSTNPPGDLTKWITEQQAISQRLQTNPFRRTLWELDPATGNDKYAQPMPIIYTGGSGDTAASAVVDDTNSRAWIMGRTVYSRFDGSGIRPLADFLKLNLAFNPAVYTNASLGQNALGFQYFPCNGANTGGTPDCKISGGDFHKIGDEGEILTGTKNAVFSSTWVADGGIDLNSGSTFNVKEYSSCDANCTPGTLFGDGAGIVVAGNKVYTRTHSGSNNSITVYAAQ